MIGFIARLFGLPGPSTLIGVALAVSIAFGSGFATAWHEKTIREEAAETKAADRALVTTGHQETVTEQVGQQAAEHQQAVQTITKTIIRKVPVYVTAKADAACPVPDGFVRVHDLAAAGLPPPADGAGQPDGTAAELGAPSGVSLSAIARTVGGNYGTCLALRGELLDWQDWARKMGLAGPAP